MAIGHSTTTPISAQLPLSLHRSRVRSTVGSQDNMQPARLRAAAAWPIHRPSGAMSTLTMNPIRYDRRQVALMVAVAAHFNPEIVPQPSKNATRAALVDAGIIPPNQALLDLFGLKAQGEGFVWGPR